MSEPISHDDMAELVAVYALDALDGAEAVAVDAHLAGCAECRALLDEHRDTAGWLGDLAGRDDDEAPPSFDRLAAVIAEEPPPLRSLPGGQEAASRRRPWLLAAAAAVVLALGAGVVIGVAGSSSPTSHPSLAQVAAAASQQSGSRRIVLAGSSGGPGVDVVLTAAGPAYVQKSSLPALDADQTYQLWAVVDGSAISLGLLGSHPGVSQFRVPPRASALAVTAEVAGGVVKSANSPVASVSLS